MLLLSENRRRKIVLRHKIPNRIAVLLSKMDELWIQSARLFSLCGGSGLVLLGNIMKNKAEGLSLGGRTNLMGGIWGCCGEFVSKNISVTTMFIEMLFDLFLHSFVNQLGFKEWWNLGYGADYSFYIVFGYCCCISTVHFWG